MAGLWQKKFNYKDGETRTCQTCGKVWHTMKPRLSCNLCYNEKSKLAQQKRKEEGKITWTKKDKYPYHSDAKLGWQGSAKQHFSNLRAKHNKAWKGGREELTHYYDEVFKNMHDNGIWDWIWDRRDRDTLDKNRKKKDSKISSDWPDTRGHYE